MMKYLLKTEELAMFLASLALFIYLGYSLPLFIILILIPDLGMVGYILNSEIGAITYNLTHHKAIAITVLLLGCFLNKDLLVALGIIMFAHSSMDRVLGYGLKYKDSFQNTHLGKIGKNKS
ncbi:MAG: DUF4260 domain-containing protein [Candidatus Dojkabacteria bacterium]